MSDKLEVNTEEITKEGPGYIAGVAAPPSQEVSPISSRWMEHVQDRMMGMQQHICDNGKNSEACSSSVNLGPTSWPPKEARVAARKSQGKMATVMLGLYHLKNLRYMDIAPLPRSIAGFIDEKIVFTDRKRVPIAMRLLVGIQLGVIITILCLFGFAPPSLNPLLGPPFEDFIQCGAVVPR